MPNLSKIKKLYAANVADYLPYSKDAEVWKLFYKDLCKLKYSTLVELNSVMQKRTKQR